MAVIGVAEVPVRPSFRGFQQTVGKEMAGVGQTMERTQGRSMGSRLMSGIGTGLKVSAGVVGAATAGILTTALVKGWQRLTAIENAEAKLKGLGHSAGDVSKIMDNALTSVKGTAFGMDEAATTAASAVAANIKPGKDLEDVLKLTADAATIAGTDMASMGAIFNKVAGSNKIQGDTIAQLHDTGIPIIQMLSKELGTSVEETYELASKGKINFATFRTAMQDGLGGAAMSAGETTSGAFANMGAALSRFGAELLTGVYPLARHVFGGITSLLDDMTGKAGPVVEAMSEKMTAGLRTFADAWSGTSSNVQQSGFLGFMQGFGSTARGVFDSVVGWVTRFREGWKASADTVESSGIAGFFKRFSRAAGGAGDTASSTGGIVESLGKILSSVGEVLPGLVSSGFSILADALGWVADNMHIITPLIPVALAGFLAWRAATAGLQVAMVRLQMAQVAMAPVLLASNIARITAVRMEAQLAAATGRTTAATAASTTAMGAKTTATATATGAQRGLNAAMRANPIGAIITAVTLLVGVLIWFFTQTETGQKIVSSAWEGIKTVVGGVVDWFQTNVVGTFKQIYGTLFGGDFGGKGALAEDSPIVAFLLKLRDTAMSVADWFTTNIVGTFKQIYGTLFNGDFGGKGALLEDSPIVGFLLKLRNTALSVAGWFTGSFVPAMKSVWNGVTSAFQVVGSIFSWVWNGVLKPTFQLFGDIMVWLWEKQIQPRLQLIQARWQLMVAMLKFYYATQIQPMIQAFGNVVRALYTNYIQPALGWISDRWSWISSMVAGFWQNNIRPILSAFGTFVKVNLVGAIRTGLSWVSERWNWITNKVSAIWNDRLKPIFQAVGDFVKNDVVGMIQDGVGMIDKAWRKVANFFRKPINWVINTVWNDGIKSAFDNVAKAVDSDARLGSIPTIPAFAKGGLHGGGWALVGEEGPELVNFTDPGRVYTSKQTQKALGGDVEPATSDLFAGKNPAEAALPMGGWISSAWDAVKGAASGVVSWVRGGLANAAESLLKPILSGVSGFVSQYGDMGELGGGLIDWGVDEILDWIRGEDKVAAGGGYEYDGPMNLGGIHRPAGGAITSWYGQRWGRLHGGVDFAAGRGAPTYAAYDGTVHSIQNYPGGSGLSINLSHGNGSYTHYGHNDPGGIAVSPGQAVKAGQRIGNMGMTGNTTGPHLHFEKWQGGLWNRTNPNNLFRDDGGLIYPGLNAVLNQDGRPEYTFNERDFREVRNIVRGGGGARGGNRYEFHAHNNGSPYQDASDFRMHQRRAERKAGV